MRPTCFPGAEGANDVLPLGTIVSFDKISGGLLKLQTNVLYDQCKLPFRDVKGVIVVFKSFAGYGSNMMLCPHFKGLYDGKHLPLPVQYLGLMLKVPKERPVLSREYVFRLLPAHEGSSGLVQETAETPVGHGSAIHDVEGRGNGHTRKIHTQFGPDAPGNTSDLHSPDAGTLQAGTPKILKVRCQGDTYSLRDETGRESCRSGQEVGGSEAKGMGDVRESFGGEPTSSEKKRERQRMVREEVVEETRRMKRIKGQSEPVMGGDGGDVGECASGKRAPGMRGGQEHGVVKRTSKEEGATTSKKARGPDGLTIREGQAMGGGDSAHPGVAAAGEPSGKSKRKVAAEEGDGQKKPRRRKTAEAASGGERSVGGQYDEAAAFWLEYERNDDGDIVEKELSVQLLIDPRKVCDIPPRERYYNHCSLNRENAEDIKAAMLSHFHKEKGKIWTKNPLVMAPIYKPVTHRPEKADRVHKDVFKPEDKDKYYYYPVNGQHTVAAVKELVDEPIFELWKMHSWPARVVWFSDEDFARYVQWMPLVTAGDNVFRKGMVFYEKWAEGKLFGSDGKTPLSRPGKHMPDKSPGLQAIPKMGSKGAVGEIKMGWLVRVPPPQTKKKTQADDKFFVVVKEPDMFCWQCLADMTDVEKLSILDDILALRGVFVQSASGHLKRQHKPGIKDIIATRKVDRVMLRMFHYILFLETEEDKDVWCYGSHFFRIEGRLLEEFGPQGLTKQVWVELRKHSQCESIRRAWKIGQTIFIFGKAHASVVWELLRNGWNVDALENEAKMIDYLNEFVKTRVADTRNDCTFVQTTGERNRDPKYDMYWKLSANKRTEVWDFLFQPGPPAQTDLEYSRRRNLVFGVVNAYHDAPRESVSHFLKRLEHVYFLMAEPLTLKNYKAQFDEEDPFDVEDMEELSDSETFDFESMPLPRVVGQVGDEGEGGPRRYSTSLASLKRVFRCEPVDNQSSDDGEKERDYDYEPCDKLSVDHDTWENERLFFFGKHHRQHLGRGGGGDKGDDGGGGGNGSQFVGKGTSETSWGEKAFGGKGSGGKDSGGKGSGGKALGGKGSGGKGSGGKGSGGKGSGGKRRTSGSPEYVVTDAHCVGSRDSDMRDVATLNSDQVRVDSHLSARTLFPDAVESQSHRAQQRSPVPTTVLLKEGGRLQHTAASPERREYSLKGTASSFCLEGRMPALRRRESATFSSLSSGERHKLRIDSKLLTSPWRLATRSAPQATVPRGQENLTFYPPHLKLGTGFPCPPPFSNVETRDWRSRDLLEGPAVGVLETGVGEYERHASEGALVDIGSKSAAASGEEERSSGTRAGVDRVVKGGQCTFVQAPVLGDDEGEEEPAVEARVHGDEKGGEPVVEGGEVTVGIQTDLHRKDDDSSPTRCGDEQGGRASVLGTGRGMVLHEAIELGNDSTAKELGNDSAATELVRDSGMVEVQNVESSMKGGEVAVSIKMDPERKYHDSPSTHCGAEQGDRVSVLSTGREMVLHEAIDLPSDSAATELVSDTVVAEVQNVESSVDVGAMAQQEGDFPQRAPENGKICE
ncbi:hypothetical protein CBR_g34843 [Chara braunii]|uniref:Uncharacterized protein n=1 Tax=Chara braunii TaxID=69332 RepID=A0A388LJM2_CHABU|nr:hypothetical protein CBR_g34843 [Chara braunii]|eukprot:GBG82467.1 hypothetical protein CBR_g34843 [Chara braunii]